MLHARTIRIPALVVGAGLALSLPKLARASGSGETADQIASTDNSVWMMIAVLAIGAAYLAANFVVRRLQRKLLVVTGLEYVLLGFLLGPAVPQIDAIDPNNLTSFLPVIALAAGWIGLVRGVAFDFGDLKELPTGVFRVSFTHMLITASGVALPTYLILNAGWIGYVPEGIALVSAVVLGLCAAADSSSPFDIIRDRYEVKGALAPFLRSATRLGDVFVIFAFGIVLCVFHPIHPTANLQLTATEWSVVLILLGGFLGMLFTLFLVGDESDDSRFLALVGIITFASGAAYFLELSPLAVNLVLGAVLANFSGKKEESVRKTLVRTEGPIRLVLLVIAGLLWHPPDFRPTLALFGFQRPAIDASLLSQTAWIGLTAASFLLLLICYIGMRIALKALASKIAVFGTDLRSDLYRGLLHHGDATVAMAISFKVVFNGNVVDIVYSLILASVVFHDLVATRTVRALLFDAGEISREQKTNPVPVGSNS